MARGAGSRLLLLGLSVAAVGKAACDPPGSEEIHPTLLALLADLHPEVLEPAITRVVPLTTALRAATEAWTASGTEEDRLAAQEAWWALMEAWQAVEVLQVGAAASSLTSEDGQDLRDEVYSWPTVNRCRVDQETVYASWDDADFFDVNLVNVYGLDALEVLLYAPPGENDCPPQVDINADGSWEALGTEGVQANRAAYAVALATHVEATVGSLAEAWAAHDFAAEPEESFDGVFDALFYVELVVKDQKLVCVDDCESPLAGGSHVWVGVNLASFDTLYTGGAGAGMDDLLRDLGEDELAATFEAALADARAAADALTEPLDVDTAGRDATYARVKTLTDLLKGDVATVLSLSIPDEAAGDSD